MPTRRRYSTDFIKPWAAFVLETRSANLPSLEFRVGLLVRMTFPTFKAVSLWRKKKRKARKNSQDDFFPGTWLNQAIGNAEAFSHCVTIACRSN